MAYRGFTGKITTIFVIIAFVFQMEIFINAQRVDEIERQFQVARELYNLGDYESAGQRLERLMAVIFEKGLDRNYIMGQCYLLQGAIFEKENQPEKAGENYRKAVDIGITKVEGVDLDALTLYRLLVKGEKPPGDERVIEGEGTKKKKKFPWLLVASGVVVVGLLVYFFLIKPRNKKYVLTVTTGEGVLGAPGNGSYVYKKGTVVSYGYSKQDGYSGLEIRLDNRIVSSSGTIKMDSDHELVISAQKDLYFVIDKETIDIDEGKDAVINVRLSDVPSHDVTALVSYKGGDTDIKIVGGGILAFTQANYNQFQEVTFHAEIDNGIVNDQTTFEILATGIPSVIITVNEKDNNTGDKKPEISIKSPSDGDTVGGKVEIRVEVSDDNGIDRIEYYIDDKSIATTQSSSYNWNTAGYIDDSHEIKVKVYDTVGQTDEDSITVTVDNDRPPTVSITSPSDGETVRGVVTIRVDAQDDSGIVTEVELYIDGDPVESDTVPPFSFKFDTRAVPNGTHFITVKAYDSRNQSSDVQIVVTVDNR